MKKKKKNLAEFDNDVGISNTDREKKEFIDRKIAEGKLTPRKELGSGFYYTANVRKDNKVVVNYLMKDYLRDGRGEVVKNEKGKNILISATGHNKNECKKVFNEKVDEYRQRKYKSSNERTVGEQVELWLESKYKNVSYNTYKNYKDNVEGSYKKVEWFWDKRLEDLDVESIEKFYEEVAELSIQRKGSGGKISRSKENQIKIILLGALEEAKKNKNLSHIIIGLGEVKIAEFPAKYIRSSKKKKNSNTNKDIVFLGEDEVEILLDYAKEYDNMLYIYSRLGLSIGARVQELLALTWEDVDLVEGVVSLNKTVVRGYGDKYKLSTKMKTKKSNRSLSIKEDSELMKELKEYKFSKGAGSQDLVFPNNKGGVMKIESFRQRFSRLLDKIKADYPNFTNITPYNLRHTYTSFYVNKIKNGEEGFNKEALKTILGHTTTRLIDTVYGEDIEGSVAVGMVYDNGKKKISV